MKVMDIGEGSWWNGQGKALGNVPQNYKKIKLKLEIFRKASPFSKVQNYTEPLAKEVRKPFI